LEVITQRHIGYVFHQGSTRPDLKNYVQEGTPKLSAAIVRITRTCLDQTTDFASPSPAERLTRRTSGDQVDSRLSQDADYPSHALRTTQVGVESQPRKVGVVRFEGGSIVVDRSRNCPTRLLKTEAETAGPGEEINS